MEGVIGVIGGGERSGIVRGCKRKCNRGETGGDRGCVEGRKHLIHIHAYERTSITNLLKPFFASFNHRVFFGDEETSHLPRKGYSSEDQWVD